MMSTLSAADDPPYLAVKSVVLNPENTRHGLPQINGLIMLLDSTTGVPVAVVDGNWVTAIRTAGASALVARRLARADSSVVTFIGCGVQAQSHLQLFSDMFPLAEVRAFGRGQANRDALCQSATSLGYTAVDCDDPKLAVEGADIIVSSVTITAVIDPFVDPHWLKPGVFVSSTDCAKCFMASGMDVFDRIVIDDVVQEAAMPDPMVDPDLISGDIAGLVNGDVHGRLGNDERCAFVFRAVALGDLALPALAYEKARKLSRGQTLK
jgi:ornithine cyclodeaminase/alanine dehydrogenase